MKKCKPIEIALRKLCTDALAGVEKSIAEADIASGPLALPSDFLGFIMLKYIVSTGKVCRSVCLCLLLILSAGNETCGVQLGNDNPDVALGTLGSRTPKPWNRRSGGYNFLLSIRKVETLQRDPVCSSIEHGWPHQRVWASGRTRCDVRIATAFALST